MEIAEKSISLFEEGKLDAAVAAAAQAVSADPLNTPIRWLYCELLCFKGDFERTDKHLDMIQTQDEASGARVWAMRQILRAAEARRQYFDEGRLPEFLAKPDPQVQHRMKATVCLREDDMAGAQEACAEADKIHRPLAGTHGEIRFADFRDGDDRFGPTIEVLSLAGKYFLLPLADIQTIEFAPPRRVIDQLWRSVKFRLRSSAEEAQGVCPVLYPGSEKEVDDEVRLGRITRWKGGVPGVPARGIGQRDFVMGENPIGILELKHLSFDAPTEP